MNRLRERLFSGIIDVLRIGIDFISIIVHPLSRLLGRNKVRILCYHRVCDLPETNDVMSFLYVPPKAFAQQMEFLSQNDFNVITLEQFIEYKDKNMKPPPKTILITFDDGYRDNYLNAFPILAKYNFMATFFVVTDCIDSDEIFHWLKLGEESLAHSQENKQYWLPLSTEEIIDMNAQGACFGSHAKSHYSLTQMDEKTAMKELRESKEYLEKILAKPVKCFSYPYGNVNKSVKDWVQVTGYRAAVTTRWGGSSTLKSDFFELRRVPSSRRDSLAKFRRKVDGAYDWWFIWLLPLVTLVQQIIFRGHRGK